jgi:hypothetical protein
VADETLVFDRDALANKGVRRDLATLADRRVILNFYKRADLCFVPDRTAVQVNQVRLKDADVASQDYVGGDGH